MVKKMFKIGGSNGVGITLDFEDLQKKLFSFSNAEEVENHFTLLTMDERLNFLKKIGDKTKGMVPSHKHVFRDAVDQMGFNTQGWVGSTFYGVRGNETCFSHLLELKL